MRKILLLLSLSTICVIYSTAQNVGIGIVSPDNGKDRIEGVLLDKTNQETNFVLGKYKFTVKHSHTLDWETTAKNDVWESAGAIII